MHCSYENLQHLLLQKSRDCIKTTIIYDKYLDNSFVKQNEVHLCAKLLVLLFPIDAISFQRSTIGTHTTNRLQAQKWQNASQFSCDGKIGMFLGDLHPRPDVFTPIIEKLSHFQMASPNPQGIFRLLKDDFNLRVERQADSLYSLLFCSPSLFAPEIRPSLQMVW